MAEKITLSGVPETMLQTVYARARESAGRGVIRDRKAEEIIGRLDYDFSLAEKAMKVLRARLLKAQQDRQADQTARERRTQVGSGDRSERIRTYNFPQGRVTDHRIGLTLYKLTAVLNGDLDELIDALATDDAARRLRQEEQTRGSTSREGSERNRGE